MISRRQFVSISGALLAATALPIPPRVNAGAATSGPLGRPIGIQLYTVREQASADLAGTLAALAAIGYREVELAGMHERSAHEFARLLNAHGLRATAAHYSMFALQTDLGQKIEDLKTLGVEHLVCSFPGTPDVARLAGEPGGPGAAIMRGGLTLDDWRWNGDEMNRVAEAAAASDLRCAYHNHAMEFVDYNGVRAFDVLLQRADAQLVDVELDCAWVAAGGENPADYIRQLGGRVTLLHIKDLLSIQGPSFETTPVGSGVIDWAAVFAAVNPGRLAHYFVEQEHFRMLPLAAARASFEYLTGLAAEQARG